MPLQRSEQEFLASQNLVAPSIPVERNEPTQFGVIFLAPLSILPAAAFDPCADANAEFGDGWRSDNVPCGVQQQCVAALISHTDSHA
jgi:hypothetical protein